MTPDQARALLDGTTPGPWRLQEVKGHPHLRHITTGTGHSGDPTAAVCIPVDVTSREGAANMAAKAAVPSMLATLAGMHTEYAIAYLDRDGNITLMDEGYETLAAAQRRRDQLLAKVRPYTRIMRRPVGEWEEA
ncbi:hypothetical protein [Microbacterium sp.]|uniref:hypothetical protein n=1 Tax=Microbacterium sp. TaxID=51671 RepID=UPI0025DA5EB8|nr:hypothetical protein [Microbacterium sp.]